MIQNEWLDDGSSKRPTVNMLDLFPFLRNVSTWSQAHKLAIKLMDIGKTPGILCVNHAELLNESNESED